jgi:thioredoxin-related protein
MKTVRTALLIFIAFSPLVTARADNIHWLIDIEEAKRQAYREQKLILLLFEYGSFDRSAKMTSEVWNQDTIIALANMFVCMRVDFEQMEVSKNIVLKDKNQKLITRYRVTSVPVVVVIDPAGNPLITFNDEAPLNDIVVLLHSLPQDLKNLYMILQTLEQNHDNIVLRIAAGDEYQRLLVPHLSNTYYTEVEDEDSVKDQPLLAEHIRSGEAVNFEHMGQVATSIEIFERLIDEKPHGEQRPYYLYMLTRLYLKRLKEIRARDYYNILKKEFPESEYTFKAWELLKD